MKYVVVAVLAMLSLASRTFAQDSTAERRLMFDRDLSSRVGAQDLLTFNSIFADFEECHLPTKLGDESTFLGRTGGRFYRLSRFILLDFQIDYLTHEIQHEAYGHGARTREFNAAEVSYKLPMGPPYGTGPGMTNFSPMESREYLVTVISGSQANHIMSDEILQQALVAGKADYHRSDLYLLTALDLPRYIWTTSYDRPDPSNDILSYLGALRRKLPADALSKLKTSATLCLADPMLWYSLYGLGHYISSGETEMRIPTIRIAGIHWLPQFRIGLTPFGWEYIMENRLIDSLHLWTISAGIDRDNQSFRLGARVRNLIATPRFRLGAELEGWRQPYPFGTTSVDFGMMALVSPEYRFVGDTRSVGVLAEIGYKSNGFLEGEPIAAGWVLRAGLSFQ